MKNVLTNKIQRKSLWLPGQIWIYFIHLEVFLHHGGVCVVFWAIHQTSDSTAITGFLRVLSILIQGRVVVAAG